MALVIEDGSIVPGANSFATRAEVIEYASARGFVLPDDETTDVLAVKAMDFMATLDFRGTAVTDQTPFPRYGLVTGDTAEDWEHFIPPAIVKAQAQLALDVHNGIDLSPSGPPSAMLKRSKVGPIEREFFAPRTTSGILDNTPLLTVAMALLAPYLERERGASLVTIRG